ncbi:MAG: TIGR00730 family Rossman fold protein [Halobacteriovoraceae bacterium]|nr:TIGR00730 family Rossman fold protein [Halobacteriovoraceae bacterium]MCB9093607.1 TIGR00730 family Rossman fold protein [Halobacteriovoraceae bacterium]
MNSLENNLSLAVFCSASNNVPKKYFERTAQFGALIAERGYHLIYGGASVGLMGTLADSALAKKARVTGVIPTVILQREVAHKNLAELIETENMHGRKEKIYHLCDAVAVLPGGLGTLDEAFEFMTWNQLGIHNKKIGFLNWFGFFDPIREFCLNAQKEKFIKNYDNFTPSFFEDDKEFLNWIAHG